MSGEVNVSIVLMPADSPPMVLAQGMLLPTVITEEEMDVAARALLPADTDHAIGYAEVDIRELLLDALTDLHQSLREKR